MRDEEKQVAVFFAVVASIIIAILLVIFLNLWTYGIVALLVGGIIFALYSRTHKFVIQVKEYERAVIFRMGKFHKVAGPGWVFIIPLLDTYKIVDLRVQTYDVKPQEVVTKDNIKLLIDAIIYMKIAGKTNAEKRENVKKAILEVEDYEEAARSYVQAHLRDVIGQLNMEEVIARVDEINKILKEQLAKIMAEWGIEVVAVEIQKVELPKTVLEAMHERKAAEQEKLAQKQRAEAEKIMIEAWAEAAKKLGPEALQYLYLEALKKVAEGQSTKIIFPLELTKLASALSSKLGIPYSEAQDKVLEQYKELLKGLEKKGVLDKLKELMS